MVFRGLDQTCGLVPRRFICVGPQPHMRIMTTLLRSAKIKTRTEHE